jgi:hypothetical protein
MKKTSKSFRMLPLQRLTTRHIEDPAEQAAVEADLKRRQQAAALAAAAANQHKNGNSSSMGKRRSSKSRKGN